LLLQFLLSHLQLLQRQIVLQQEHFLQTSKSKLALQKMLLLQHNLPLQQLKVT
jgi:hypothetical protein